MLNHLLGHTLFQVAASGCVLAIYTELVVIASAWPHGLTVVQIIQYWM